MGSVTMLPRTAHDGCDRCGSEECCGSFGLWEHMRRWDQWMKARGLTEKTRDVYRRAMVKVLSDIMLDPRDISEAALFEYLDSVEPQGHGKGDKSRAVKSFYRFASKRGIAANIAEDVVVKRKKYGEAPKLSKPEVSALLEAAGTVDPRAPHAIRLALATGARLGSLCAATAEDVQGNVIHWRVAKNDDPYKSFLGKAGREAVAGLLALSDYSPRYAGTRQPTLVGVGTGRMWSWVNESATLAGIRAHPHLLRHTFGHELAKVADQITWTKSMNHRDASLMTRYADTDDERRMASVEDLFT